MAITFNPLTRSLDNTVEGQTNLGTNTNFGDNVKLTFGVGNDLEIFHDGSQSIIKDNGTGQLLISGENTIALTNAAGTENYARFLKDGAVELYHDNVLKCATSSSGLDLPDNSKLQLGDSQDLKVYHTGTLGVIRNVTGTLFIDSNDFEFRSSSGSSAFQKFIKLDSDADGDGGVVELYHDNVKKAETSSSGFDLAADNNRLRIGAGQDLQLYHTTSGNSVIKNDTGVLYISGDDVRIVNNAIDESGIKFAANGAVELYFNGAKKFETISDGCTVSQNLNVGSELNLVGGSDGDRFFDAQVGTGALNIRKITGGDAGHETMAKFIGDAGCELYHNAVKKFETTGSGITVQGSVTTQDMNMSNLNGSANEVDNTKGSWSLQEGANDLFLINRVNGKKYKFNLTEIN